MAGPTKTLFDELVRLDDEAKAVLGPFYEWLKAPSGKGFAPEAASPLAHEADRYARDFLAEILELPLGGSTPAVVSSYLSNWYIVNTLYPTHTEVDRIVEALRLFHEYLKVSGIISESRGGAISGLLSDAAPFHERLETFWSLTPEEVADWRAVEDYRALKAGNSLQ